MKNPEADDSSKNWAWTLWKAEMPVEGSDIQLMCRVRFRNFSNILILLMLTFRQLIHRLTANQKMLLQYGI